MVMALGSGFIMLSLLTYYSQLGPSANWKKELLETYAQKIEQNVTFELNDILIQIDTNNNHLKKLVTDNKGTKGENAYDNVIIQGSQYKYSKGTIWMDANGQQLVKWQPGKITPRVPVGFRKYFSVPNNPKSVLWSDESINRGEGFYIEAIRTVTTGKSYAMISKRPNAFPLKKLNNREASVVSMGSKMESLTKLSLPSNISYLVIDEKGRVVFHKDSTKIMQENLFEETNNNKALTAAVYGRVDTIFKCNYNEVHSRFYITPLHKLPLFLLLVLDEEREKMTELHTLSLTVLFYFLLFLLLLVQFGLFVVADYRRKKKVRGYSLFFKWVWPTPARKKAFILLSAYLLLSMAIFIIGNFYQNVLLAYAFFSLLVTVNLFVLRGFKKPFPLRYKPYYLKYYIYFAAMLLIGILLLPFSEMTSYGWKFTFFILLSVFTVYCSLLHKSRYERLSLRMVYNSWVFLFMVALGVLPVFGFYTRAYNFEKSVYLQHVQLSLAKNIVRNGELFDSNKYRNYKSLDSLIIQQSILKGDKISKGREYEFIKELRIQLGNKTEKTAVLKYIPQDKKQVMSWLETDSVIRLTYRPGKLKQAVEDSLVLTAHKPKICPVDYLRLSKSKFDGFRLEMFIAFLLLMVLLYLVVSYWTSRLFLLDIIPRLKSNINDCLRDSDFIYIISPPHAGVRPFVENKLKEKVFFEDLRYPKSSKGEGAKLPADAEVALVFDSASLDNDSLRYSLERIDALKKLVLSSKSKLKKLIVISQFTPKKVSNTVLEREQLLQGKEKEEVLFELKKLSAQYLDLLGGFDLTYFKLGENKLVCALQGNCFYPKRVEGIRKLDLLSMTESADDSLCDNEDHVLNTQNREQLFYHAIWNSLEKREHLLIYDLAQDGLVNYRNLYVVYNLMSRGILIHTNGRLKLFNKSFANFVLTIIDKEQALEFERDAKRTGSWANLKLPLIIVIAAVLMFMFLSQQEVFNQLIGWFTAAIALLPVLTRFMVTFSGFSKK
jgi:hypothetical protein